MGIGPSTVLCIIVGFITKTVNAMFHCSKMALKHIQEKDFYDFLHFPY